MWVPDHPGRNGPISKAADGRIVYRPMLSIAETYGSARLSGEHHLGVRAGSTEVLLIDPEDFDRPLEVTAEDSAAAAPIDAVLAPLRSYFAEEDGVVATPDRGLPTSSTTGPTNPPSSTSGAETRASRTRRWDSSRRCRTSGRTCRSSTRTTSS